MKNSVSDQSFYIESDEENESRCGESEDDGNHSDSDNSMADDDNRHQSKTGSYTTSWPQSYRQSVDLLSSVPSPSINFLGTPVLSRFSSSFLSSSLTLRRPPTHESLPTEVSKPLLHKLEDDHLPPPHKRSSHALLPPLPSRKHAIKEEKPAWVSHEHPIAHQSSYWHTVLNGINLLCGVGILSTPYAAKEGGWLGLLILLTFAVLSFYTGLLLRYCLDSEPGLETYPDIGQAAFGTTGRFTISIILYAELYSCCVEYIILEGDNLSSLFPNAHLSFGGFQLDSSHLFAVLATLAVLPTVWLRDMSILSYISAGGVLASLAVAVCLFWVGVVDKVGFHSEGTLINLGTLPVSIGLYGYCYSGHAVFPNIYSSMADRNRYPSALLVCFVICTALYGGVAYMGYTMFGEGAQSQFTLNMPKDLIASKIAVWTTVVNPFTKYALTISPVAMSLEELIPSNSRKTRLYAICIRTALVISTLLVGLAIPFFGLVMSLIGSLLTMLVALILPCVCFLSILRRRVTVFQASVCVVIITVGSVSAVFGTYSALSKIIERLSQ